MLQHDTIFVQVAGKQSANWLGTYAPLLISSLALIVTIWNHRRSALRGMRPVLVVTFRDDIWKVVNVGNGPALEVLVACKIPNGSWEKPVRIPPMGKDDQFELSWLNSVNDRGLGVRYRDAEGRWYTSRTGDDLTNIEQGNKLPHWAEPEIGRYWAADLVQTHGYPQ